MKNILITGAGGGMGRATCKLLSQRGYRVWGLDIVPSSDTDGWNYIQTDITDISAITNARDMIQKNVENLSAIIHMAGIYELDSLVEMSEERFIRTFDVNLFGAWRINKAFIPLLEKGGRIIITTSELAPLDPLPFTGIYGVSKTVLEKYAYSLRMELQLLGCSVSVLRPGAVDTGLLSVSTDRLDDFCRNTQLYSCNAERFRRIVNSVESKNIPPEAIARLALRALEDRKPKYIYNINRNILLKLLNVLPAGLQTYIIRKILK